MKLYVSLLVALCSALAIQGIGYSTTSESSDKGSGKLVPPATPLIACDPFFSVWSQAGQLTDVETTHWTGRQHRLSGLVRIDGEAYRIMGREPEDVPALQQTDLTVTPTQSIYEFSGAGVAMQVSFTTPLLPDDVDILSRPITYMTVEARATDGEEHEVEVFFGASAELAVNNPSQLVVHSMEEVPGLRVHRIGTQAQPVLASKGDDHRIDWGYLYIAARDADVVAEGIGEADTLYESFVNNEGLPSNSVEEPFPAEGSMAGLVVRFPSIGDEATSRYFLVAYDDLYSIEFMHKWLRPYWRRDGLDAAGLLEQSAKNYESLKERCDAFDRELMDDLKHMGGDEYAQIAALAYRQCFAAGKIVADAAGQPIQFSKENHSNGCMATADVFYPMSPQFLLFGPALAKSFLVPYLEYGSSDRWKFPFAPHDLGTYPKANGQVYGGGEHSEENQMPVEECGNVLILMAAVARVEGHAEFADRYWESLTSWAEYLRDEGYNPGNQLCTDDFAGHLAQNVNLSAKAICGLGAYSQLCELRGDHETAQEYRQVAEEFAERWMEEADAGDHYRLTFDRPDTWSQKYNLVWDRVLGLELFPDSVRRKEMDHYLRVQNEYGLPLDNRSTYTKLDWILWSATLTEDRDDFVALVRPVFRFLQETPDKSPMTDWYHTHNARKVGFTARPVVGAVFMPLLYDDAIWQKWSQFGNTEVGEYAPMPKPPKITSVVPTADFEPVTWRYTTRQPGSQWWEVDFDDSEWSEGQSGFGTRGTPGALVGTQWNSRRIWLRRQFDLTVEPISELMLYLHHDEDVAVYINGILAAELSGYSTGYFHYPLSEEARASLQPTGNTFAVRCRQTVGGQYIDVGLVLVEEVED